jgi:hypothetical protein
LESFSQRPRQQFRFFSDLLVEVADLRPQFLDAGMIAEQRRGLLGELRAQSDALLGQPANQLGIENV